MHPAELVDEPLAFEEGGAEFVDAPVGMPDDTRSVAPLGEWLVRIAAREGQAMRELHDAVNTRVQRVVTRIVPDAHLADEVVSECFWQVWREASRFDATRGSVTGWVTTIARSRALDAMRRRKALANHETALTDEHEESWAPADQSPSATLEARQRGRTLDAALTRIDPIQRQLLSLAFVVGLSHEEMATHCGLALGTVKSHIRRGLAQMRTHCVRAGLRP